LSSGFSKATRDNRRHERCKNEITLLTKQTFDNPKLFFFFETHHQCDSSLFSTPNLNIAWKRKSTDASQTANSTRITSLARDLCEQKALEITGGVWEVGSQNTKLDNLLQFNNTH